MTQYTTIWDLTEATTQHRRQIAARHARARQRRIRRDWAWGIALTLGGWGFVLAALLVTT